MIGAAPAARGTPPAWLFVAAPAALLSGDLAVAGLWDARALPGGAGLCAVAAGLGVAGRCISGPVALRAAFAAAILVPSLSFRVRTVGETGLDWQNGVKLVAWALLLTLAIARRRQIGPLLGTPPVLCALGYAATALLSTLWSPVPPYTFGSALGLAAWLSAALLAVACMEENAAVRLLATVLALEIGLGLVGALVVPDVAWLPPSIEETSWRLQGFSGHPNLFGQHAGLLVLAAPAGGILARRRGRAIAGAMALLGVVGLAASGSRTTAMAVAAAGLVAAIGTKPRPRRWLAAGMAAIVAAAALAACALLPAPEALFQTLSRTGASSELTTLTGRTDLWAAAWAHVLERPLLGWGFNGTEQLMLESVGRDFPGNAVNAHNMVLQGLMSLGFVGAMPGLAGLGLLVVALVRRPDRRRDAFVVFLFVVGFGEAEFFATPVLLTGLALECLARDAARHGHRDLRPIGD